MPKINFSSSNIENKNNKITSFTVGSSSNSDSTYPSTKAISTAVSNYVAANAAPVTIVESGTLDGWYYQKLSDGGCYIQKSVQLGALNIDMPFGSACYQNANFSFPSGLLIEAPIVNLTPFNGGELLACSINFITKDTCIFYLFNTRSITNASPRILVNGYGRWK